MAECAILKRVKALRQCVRVDGEAKLIPRIL